MAAAWAAASSAAEAAAAAKRELRRALGLGAEEGEDAHGFSPFFSPGKTVGLTARARKRCSRETRRRAFEFSKSDPMFEMSVCEELDELQDEPDRFDELDENPDEVELVEKFVAEERLGELGELFLAASTVGVVDSEDEPDLTPPNTTSSDIRRASVGGGLTTKVFSVVNDVLRKPEPALDSSFSLINVNSRNRPVLFNGGMSRRTFFVLSSASLSELLSVQQLLLSLLLPELDPKLLRLPVFDVAV